VSTRVKRSWRVSKWLNNDFHKSVGSVTPYSSPPFFLSPLFENYTSLPKLKDVMSFVFFIKFDSYSVDCYLFCFLSFFDWFLFQFHLSHIWFHFIFMSNLVFMLLIAICFVFYPFYYFLLNFIPRYFIDCGFGFVIFMDLPSMKLIIVSWLGSLVSKISSSWLKIFLGFFFQFHPKH